MLQTTSRNTSYLRNKYLNEFTYLLLFKSKIYVQYIISIYNGSSDVYSFSIKTFR